LYYFRYYATFIYLFSPAFHYTFIEAIDIELLMPLINMPLRRCCRHWLIFGWLSRQVISALIRFRHALDNDPRDEAFAAAILRAIAYRRRPFSPPATAASLSPLLI
jgi:hypothetical protein